MIASDIRHIELQVRMTSHLEKAFDFLRRPEINNLPEGRIEIDGDRVFAIAQRYETSRTDVPRFEYHKKYIDIQYIVSGEEVIGWAPVDRMKVTEIYDEDKDIAFGEAAQWSPLFLHAGQAALLYPEDAHAPRLAAGSIAPVFKIVIKVARESHQ